MNHKIAILVENEPGALSRIVGLFAQRNYNIDSLTVAKTHAPSLSRVTVVTTGDEKTIEQICKQLHRIVSVFRVDDISQTPHVERELMLLKVRAIGSERSEIKRTADIYGARIVDVTPTTYVIEFSAKTRSIESFLRAIDEKHIIEVTRSGVVGIVRGERGLSTS